MSPARRANVYSIFDTQVSLLRMSVELLVGDSDGTRGVDAELREAFELRARPIRHAPVSPHTGGVETHVREIATRLADRGNDITVFSADARADVLSEYTDDSVRVRRFRSVSPGGAFYIAPQLALAVRRADADTVHAPNYQAVPLFFAALGVTDERFIVTAHYRGESASGIRDVPLSFYRPSAAGPSGRPAR